MKPRKHRIVLGKDGKPKAPAPRMAAGQRKKAEGKARRMEREWRAKSK